MQWIKELELDDSVDESRSSLSIRGISMPNFVVLDARIASALTKSSIIPTSKEESVRGRQIAYLIYDYFRVIGSHDSVENFADLFTIGLRNYDALEFD